MSCPSVTACYLCTEQAVLCLCVVTEHSEFIVATSLNCKSELCDVVLIIHRASLELGYSMARKRGPGLGLGPADPSKL